MNVFKKRDRRINSVVLFCLDPGESVFFEEKLGKRRIVSRRTKRSLTAKQIGADLQRIWIGAPEIDPFGVLHGLRE